MTQCYLIVLTHLCPTLYLVTYGQNFNFKRTRDNGKNSYKRSVYESVDDKSLY